MLQELRAIVPDLPSLAVQRLILPSQEEPGMVDCFRRFPWVLETLRYDDAGWLVADLPERIMAWPSARPRSFAEGPSRPRESAPTQRRRGPFARTRDDRILVAAELCWASARGASAPLATSEEEIGALSEVPIEQFGGPALLPSVWSSARRPMSRLPLREIHPGDLDRGGCGREIAAPAFAGEDAQNSAILPRR